MSIRNEIEKFEEVLKLRRTLQTSSNDLFSDFVDLLMSLDIGKEHQEGYDRVLTTIEGCMYKVKKKKKIATIV